LKAFVGVTDFDWYTFLSALPEIDEVNFWQPGGSHHFQSLSPGEPFLFKLHSPRDYVVGGGNMKSLRAYFHLACRLLRKWLNRRSQRRSMTWPRFWALMIRWLPRVQIVHNLYPQPLWRTQTGSRMV
jgi:hypothetical protein